MVTKIQLKKVLGLSRMFVLLPASMLVVLAWTTTDESIAQLRLDHAALRAAEDDYRAQREIGLDGTEAADYAGYIARLQRRVFEDCRAVFESDSPFPPDLPCPVSLPQAPQSADITTDAELTPREQIAALDTMLNAGLGEYDEKLLREQERVRAATPNDNPNGGEGGGDGGTEGEGDSGTVSKGPMGEGAAGETSGEGQDTGGRRGGPEDSSTGSDQDEKDSDQESDIPDGSDDDVVARQLREAAEKETDPELKAKLWEEYRRYKRGTS